MSTSERPPSPLAKVMTLETRPRRIAIAVAIYVLCSIVFAVTAGSQRLTEHTQYNHFALLADAWVHGRQDIEGGPPAYAGNNDFAQFEGKTYISFPPFPALLMTPFVALAGSASNFRDGQFMVLIAGLGPAFLFLALEKLRRTGRSPRTEKENLALALLFAFGTVYFFTAVEGTVWFAGMVTGVVTASIYLLSAFDAERPILAGLAMAGCWTSRVSMAPFALVFLLEAVRVSSPNGLPTEGTFLKRIEGALAGLDKAAFFRKVIPFFAPIVLSVALVSWMNDARFHNPAPWAFGHEHLGVAWHTRILKWGLFSYHYLAKNLGVMLTILPWMAPHDGSGNWDVPFRINEHGLALWFTTPIYLFLFWPKKRGWVHGIALFAALFPLTLDLLYQNSGWRQFGYRFSNDYALLLFVLLAVGERPFSRLFKAAAAWGVAWALFGAATFDHTEFDHYYWREGSQRVLYQDD